MCFPILIICLIGIGYLEASHPNALSLSNFNDNYTGKGWAGLILLVLELIIAATWSKATGITLAMLGISLLGLWLIGYARDKLNHSTEDLIQIREEDEEPLSFKTLVVGSALLGYREYRKKKTKNSE